MLSSYIYAVILKCNAQKTQAQDGHSNIFNGVTLNGVLLATSWSKWCEWHGLQSRIFIPAHDLPGTFHHQFHLLGI